MENINLSMRETRRYEVMQQVMAGRKTMAEAGQLLGIKERQGYRIKAAIIKKGIRGAIHGNRGRRPWNALPADLLERVVKLRKEVYVGFNDRHFKEKLAEEEGLKIGREKVRQTLRAASIRPERVARKPKHRQRRERRSREASVLQMDASPHDWLEGRGPWLDLIHATDDATNREWGHFELAETTEGYFKQAMDIFSKDGLPESIYVDRHSIFWTDRDQTMEEQLLNKRPLTEFGRAMDELGVGMMYAGSAQAKGRVERTGGTHQDRLVSELRLANAKTLEEANIVAKKYFKNYNKKFMRQARDKEKAWRPIPENIDLKHILCWKDKRVVKNDNTISLDGVIYQIPPSDVRCSFAKATVEVHKLLDDTITIHYKNNEIAKFKAKTAFYKADRGTQISKPISEYPPKMAILPPPRATQNYGSQPSPLS
ncbi:MAG: ISNCY family transposase [Pseudomonadota bacterium]